MTDHLSAEITGNGIKFSNPRTLRITVLLVAAISLEIVDIAATAYYLRTKPSDVKASVSVVGKSVEANTEVLTIISEGIQLSDDQIKRIEEVRSRQMKLTEPIVK